MPVITDKDRHIFKEAAMTVLLSFTELELAAISKLASELREIIEAAKKRDQENFRKAH